MHRMLLAVPFVLAGAQIALAPDRVIGLLTLPEVFGNGACDKFQPEDVILYSAPDGRQIVGRIRVDKYWTFAPEGGCGGLTVNVHDAASGTIIVFPTQEYEYEAPAAIVLEQRSPWFRVRTPGRSAWVRGSHRDEYHTLERLLADGLTYLTPTWDGRLAPSPGGATRATERPAPTGENTAVNVVGFRQRPEGLWVEVDVYSYSPCLLPSRLSSRAAGRPRMRHQASWRCGSTRAGAEGSLSCRDGASLARLSLQFLALGCHRGVLALIVFVGCHACASSTTPMRASQADVSRDMLRMRPNSGSPRMVPPRRVSGTAQSEEPWARDRTD